MTSAAPLCAGAERRRRPPAGGAGTWSWHISTKGDDFDLYLAQLESAGYERNEVTCFTAHQMGSCRMGSDPATSVADGRGELHDVPGVWIGDASAFPTAPGVNPMVSIMALAHRTADELLA